MDGVSASVVSESAVPMDMGAHASSCTKLSRLIKSIFCCECCTYTRPPSLTSHDISLPVVTTSLSPVPDQSSLTTAVRNNLLDTIPPQTAEHLVTTIVETIVHHMSTHSAKHVDIDMSIDRLQVLVRFFNRKNELLDTQYYTIAPDTAIALLPLAADFVGIPAGFYPLQQETPFDTIRQKIIELIHNQVLEGQLDHVVDYFMTRLLHIQRALHGAPLYFNFLPQDGQEQAFVLYFPIEHQEAVSQSLQLLALPTMTDLTKSPQRVRYTFSSNTASYCKVLFVLEKDITI